MSCSTSEILIKKSVCRITFSGQGEGLDMQEKKKWFQMIYPKWKKLTILVEISKISLYL